MIPESGSSGVSQPQVIYIVQPRQSIKASLKESYPAKAATVLGCIHIICGFFALGADISGIVVHDVTPVATGIWTSFFFFVCGGLAISGARSGYKCLVVATMVFAIITAVCAGILIIMSSIFMAIEASFRCRGGCVGMVTYPIQIVAGVTMLVAAVVSSALTCKAICCRQVQAGAVHYTPNYSHVQLPGLPTTVEAGLANAMEAGLSTETSEDSPPNYADCSKGAFNYQKF